MVRIHLSEIGPHLSGRGQGAELVKSRVAPLGSNAPVILDFTGVRAMTQSFISGFFVACINSGIKIESMQFENSADPELIRRAANERSRLLKMPHQS